MTGAGRDARACSSPSPGVLTCRSWSRPGPTARTRSAWRTRLARLATTAHGADWILHADADELWWPLVGTIRDSLRLVPAGYDAVLAPACNFLYVQNDGAPVIAGLLVREVRRSLAGLPTAHARTWLSTKATTEPAALRRPVGSEVRRFPITSADAIQSVAGVPLPGAQCEPARARDLPVGEVCHEQGPGRGVDAPKRPSE